MSRTRMLVGSVAVTAVAVLVAVAGAGAANTKTTRDCSFPGGIDPDFVQLSGATVGPNGGLHAQSQQKVTLKASESSNPGDSSQHVTLSATVSAPGAVTRTVSGAGTGKVIKKLPLVGSSAGRSNTVSWSATFDNGQHHCPSSSTPQNSSPHPFVIRVTGPACVVPNVKGKTLDQAKAALKAAHCRLGQVSPKGQTSGTVKSQKPGAGKVFAPGTSVNVTLH
jgi:PASTA domain